MKTAAALYYLAGYMHKEAADQADREGGPMLDNTSIKNNSVSLKEQLNKGEEDKGDYLPDHTNEYVDYTTPKHMQLPKATAFKLNKDKSYEDLKMEKAAIAGYVHGYMNKEAGGKELYPAQKYSYKAGKEGGDGIFSGAPVRVKRQRQINNNVPRKRVLPKPKPIPRPPVRFQQPGMQPATTPKPVQTNTSTGTSEWIKTGPKTSVKKGSAEHMNFLKQQGRDLRAKAKPYRPVTSRAGSNTTANADPVGVQVRKRKVPTYTSIN